MTSEFINAMMAAGFAHLPATIEPGRLYRFPGIGARKADLAGWCRLFDDMSGGVFGDWRTGLSETWVAKRGKPLGRIERIRIRRDFEQARIKREKERRRSQKKAADKAQALWGRGSEKASNHPYLVAKGIQAHSVRTDGRHLLVPVQSISGDLWSLQLIDVSGSKRFLPGGRVKGGMCRIGLEAEDLPLLICEGFATGATLHEQTGYPVIVAFNAGNLKPVAKALRGQNPRADLVICADNDRHTPGNPGVAKAREAAAAAHGRLAVPSFEDDEVGTDWNDWYLNRQVKRRRQA